MSEVDEELQDFFAQLASDPEIMDELTKARAQLARSIPRDCPWGRCEISIDPLDNTIVSAIGPIGCGCDFMPGWRSKYYEGLPKPGFAVKARGRHGSRVARKARITREHECYLDELAAIWARNG